MYRYSTCIYFRVGRTRFVVRKFKLALAGCSFSMYRLNSLRLRACTSMQQCYTDASNVRRKLLFFVISLKRSSYCCCIVYDCIRFVMHYVAQVCTQYDYGVENCTVRTKLRTSLVLYIRSTHMVKRQGWLSNFWSS